MRDFGIREMLTEQIDIRDIAIFSVHEPLNHGLSFLNKARSSNALCLYQSGRREYEIIGGEAFALTEGDIMYIPQNARYRFRITDTGDQARDYIIVINFNMVDCNGEAVIFGEFPRILMQDKLSHYFTLFHRMENVVMSRQNHTLYVKSLLYTLFYEILYELYSLQDMNLPHHAIMPAINIIESDPARAISVPELAKFCGVSETRFRRLFSEYSGGMSPVEYRNRLRIEKAEKMIRTGLVTVETAAWEAGFRDLSYFYRIYRKLKGTAPLAQL